MSLSPHFLLVELGTAVHKMASLELPRFTAARPTKRSGSFGHPNISNKRSGDSCAVTQMFPKLGENLAEVFTVRKMLLSRWHETKLFYHQYFCLISCCFNFLELGSFKGKNMPRLWKCSPFCIRTLRALWNSVCLFVPAKASCICSADLIGVCWKKNDSDWPADVMKCEIVRPTAPMQRKGKIQLVVKHGTTLRRPATLTYFDIKEISTRPVRINFFKERMKSYIYKVSVCNKNSKHNVSFLYLGTFRWLLFSTIEVVERRLSNILEKYWTPEEVPKYRDKTLRSALKFYCKQLFFMQQFIQLLWTFVENTKIQRNMLHQKTKIDDLIYISLDILSFQNSVIEESLCSAWSSFICNNSNFWAAFSVSIISQIGNLSNLHNVTNK